MMRDEFSDLLDLAQVLLEETEASEIGRDWDAVYVANPPH